MIAPRILPCWLFGWLLCVTFNALAADSWDRSQIETQKLALQKERDAVNAIFEISARQCWQRFMVNDCLHSARLQRRQAMGPLDKQEHAIRAAQRALMVMERQERLDAKQPVTPELNDNQP